MYRIGLLESSLKLLMKSKRSMMNDHRDRSLYKYFIQMQSRWCDNDMYGHVNNVVYGQWIDSIVNHYLIEKCSFNPMKSASIGFVVSSYCNYYQPVSYPSNVFVGLFVKRIGNSSVDYTVGIFDSKESVKASSVGGFRHVFVDRITNRPKVLEKCFMSRSTNELKIVLNEGYAWILFEVILITIHIWITGMMMASVRKRFFNKDFYQKQFPQYKSLSNVMKPDGGYPDDGQGRLANLLNDEQWFTFNNYRRAHMNYLEGAFAVIIPLLISGLSYTRVSFFTGIVYIVGREIYSQGYRRSGSKGRLYGAILLDLALLILWSMALYTCFHWGNGLTGLTRFIFSS